MMTKTALIVIVTVGGVALVGAERAPHTPAPSTQDQQQDISITLSSKTHHPTLAIPAFRGGGDAALEAAAKVLTTVLWMDLDFEKEFSLVSQDAVSKMPAIDGVDTLPADRWAELGADSVVIGTLARAADGFTIDVKLVGTKGDEKNKIQFGELVKGCVVDNPRRCAHFLADDLHKKLRGVDGVAQTRLAFTSDRNADPMMGRHVSQGAGQSKDIYISDYDGDHEQRITANHSLNLGPSWAPDGRTLAYTSYVSGYPDIFVSNIFEARAASHPAAGNENDQNYLASWSPDGTKLAVATNRGGAWDIWVVDRDGRNMHNVTNSHNIHINNNSPTWSPTGQFIAFVSDRSGTPQIYVIGVDGLGLDKVTSERADCPSWSPAGRNVIAYTSGGGPGHDVNIVDVGTHQVTVLTDGIGSNESPSFAPNGRHIAITTTRYGKNQIALVSVTGGIQRQVTRVGNNTYPNWSRTPQVP